LLLIQLASKRHWLLLVKLLLLRLLLVQLLIKQQLIVQLSLLLQLDRKKASARAVAAHTDLAAHAARFKGKTTALRAVAARAATARCKENTAAAHAATWPLLLLLLLLVQRSQNPSDRPAQSPNLESHHEVLKLQKR
jgi:hypothetical protein